MFPFAGAGLVSSLARSVCSSETLPVEHLGGRPLCMNQYYEVLSSCRIPGLRKDSVVNHAKSCSPPKHITIIHNCQVRKVGELSLCLGSSPPSPIHPFTSASFSLVIFTF